MLSSFQNADGTWGVCNEEAVIVDGMADEEDAWLWIEANGGHRYEE